MCAGVTLEGVSQVTRRDSTCFLQTQLQLQASPVICLEPQTFTRLFLDEFLIRKNSVLTDEQKKYATQAFMSLDDRRTGSIPNTKETMIDAVRLSGLNPTEIEIDQLMKGTGAGFGDKLTKDEFLMVMTKVDWKPTDEVRDMLLEDFRLFVDNRPAINQDEFIYVLTREGRERISLDDAKQLVAKFDKDREGNIKIEEMIDRLLAIAPT